MDLLACLSLVQFPMGERPGSWVHGDDVISLDLSFGQARLPAQAAQLQQVVRVEGGVSEVDKLPVTALHFLWGERDEEREGGEREREGGREMRRGRGVSGRGREGER